MQRPENPLNLSQTSAVELTPACACAQGRSIATLMISLLVCVLLDGCCQPNDPNCRNVSIGPSGAEVAGVAIGVGAAVTTAVAIEVHHANHTLSGCVTDTQAGMRLQTYHGAKGYLLSGNTANVKAGERVRLHGTRVKAQKHSTADPTFLVERQTKDLGPCKLPRP